MDPLIQDSASTQSSLKLERANQLRQQAINGGINARRTREVAEEFESVFLSAMLAPMFNGESMNNSLNGSHAESTYKGLLVEEYAKEITKAGGIGVADHIYREMMSLQEVKP